MREPADRALGSVVSTSKRLADQQAEAQALERATRQSKPNRTGSDSAARIAGLLRRLAAFSVVGGSGVAINMGLLVLLHERLLLSLVVASPIAIGVSILNNFLLNNYWTFRQDRLQVSRMARFYLVSAGGLAINTGVLMYLVQGHGVYYLLANLCAIGVATAWNFTLNSFWTWNV